MRHVCALITSVIAVAAPVACGGRGTDGIKDGFTEPNDGLDPSRCSEVSVKIKSFLEATVALYDAVASLEADVKVSCQAIAEELGVPTEGNTEKVCNAVASQIKANLKAGLKGKAKLQIDYKPAVCEVKADIAAEAAAKCEAKASADIKVECTGKCEGTCSGTCSGTCEGSGAASAGGGGGKAAGRGKCEGKCDGSCQGSCSGGCSGSADVNASAECEAKAEVTANVEAECTPPELDIKFDASAVADAPKVEATIKALKKGLPKLIAVKAKLTGPVALAFKSWAKAVAGLKETINDTPLCIGAQIALAASLLDEIEESMRVSIGASALVSASATGSAG